MVGVVEVLQRVTQTWETATSCHWQQGPARREARHPLYAMCGGLDRHDTFSPGFLDDDAALSALALLVVDIWADAHEAKDALNGDYAKVRQRELLSHRHWKRLQLWLSFCHSEEIETPILPRDGCGLPQPKKGR